MSDAVGRGITVTEIAAMDQPIDATPETTAAFVGRALRGPLNTPVMVESVGQFRRRFGGDWPGSSLAAAVRQFFEHGGKRLAIVRVANQARSAMLYLPAAGSALVLRAVDPGASERIRAAVDFDGIDPADDVSFNLTLQRLDPETGLILDQEIYAAVSYVESDDAFVGDGLRESSIARLDAPYPTHLPEATRDPDSRFSLNWIDATDAGTDGEPLTDYDIVGSRIRGTGLFALDQTERFDILYLPPAAPGQDCGPAAVLAADGYCRGRGALLILDPAPEWASAEHAARGIRQLGYASPNIMCYFPRLKSAINAKSGVAGGAIAGLLCKLDRTLGPWQDLDDDRLGFARALKPVISLDDEDVEVLRRAGINALVEGSARRTHIVGATTLGRGSESQRMFVSLPVRRTCLGIINNVGLGTRWAVFEEPDERLSRRLRGQVHAYLDVMADLGALESRQFVVDCDAGLSLRDDRLEHGVTILLVFHPAGSPLPVSFTIHQTAAGLRVTGTAFAPVAEHCA